MRNHPTLSPLAAALAAGAAADGQAAWALHAEALAAEEAGRDVIVLSVGDPDLDAPQSARQAAIAALEAGDGHYTPIVGRASLRAAVAERHRARGGPAVGPENVMIASGAQNALYLTLRCLLGPGDEAVAPEPTYVSYAGTVAAAGATLIRTPSPADGGFRPDLDALEAALTPRTRVILIGDPNNPTGVVLTEPERARLADIARAHGLWLVADTVYETLAYDGPRPPAAAAPGMAERTATVGSVSKSHAMTGWRVGWVVGPTPLIDACETLGHAALYGLPGFAQAGAEAALADQAAEQRVRATFRARTAALTEGLSAVPGLRVLTPQAGMFALADIRAFGLPSDRFLRSLFETEGVSALDGAAFGPSAAGWIRFSATRDAPRLREACARVARFCAGL